MDWITKEQEEIKKQVLEHFHIGQAITYAEFLVLYHPYQEKISEVEFASILEISCSRYETIRSTNSKARIFNKSDNKITEKKEKIKQEVLEQVQIGQLITYKEFLVLYHPYREEVSEVEFARILEISCNNFQCIKSSSGKTRVFCKSANKITEEEKEKIKQEVLEQVEIGQKITYEEFLVLYHPYREKVSEVEFASILEIGYNRFHTIKRNGGKVRIFNKSTRKITEEEKEKIKQEVLKQVQIGQSITYAEFLILYHLYQEKISETEFASILEMRYNGYEYIKNTGGKTKIFKNGDSKIAGKEKIKQEVLKQVQIGQSITYAEFLVLYYPYQEKISEVEFASILEINSSGYKYIKTTGGKTKVFKKSDIQITEEEKEKIKQEVLTKVQAGQAITYTEFLTLYAPYKTKISESKFASILEISWNNFQCIKSSGKKARIFQKSNIRALEKEKEKIKQEVLEHVQMGQLITYEEFLVLYAPYKTKLSEVEFASILEISYDSLKNIKNTDRKMKVFTKSDIQITEEAKEKIKQEVLTKVQIGQAITYSEFLSLYAPYQEKINKGEFANILGISYANYCAMRTKKQRAVVKNNIKVWKIKRIKHLLKESRFYSKEELEFISKKYEIKLSEILQEIYHFSNEKDLINLEDCLKTRGKLWLGKVKCSKEFAEQYAPYMIKIATVSAKNCCRKYKREDIRDDVISNSIMFIIENYGDIEKNYLMEEQIKKAIAALINTYVVNYFLWYSNNTYSLFTIKNNDDEEINMFDRGIIDTATNVEEEVIANIEAEEKIDFNYELLEESCLKLLKKYLEIGYDEKAAILEVSKFVGIDVQKILEMLKQHMLEQQSVKMTSKGSYILK